MGAAVCGGASSRLSGALLIPAGVLLTVAARLRVANTYTAPARVNHRHVNTLLAVIGLGFTVIGFLLLAT